MTLRAVHPSELPAPSATVWIGFERAVALIVLFLIAARLDVSHRVTAGDVALVVCLPLWLSAVRSNRWVRYVLAASVLAAVSSVLLAVQAEPNRDVVGKEAFVAVTTIVGIGAAAAFIVWSRRILSTASVSIAFGFGLLVGRFVNGGVSPSNAWKFTFQFPVTLMLLGVALYLGKPILQVAVLAVMAWVSADSDGRSAFVTLALAAVIVSVPYMRSLHQVIPRRWWAALLLMVVVGAFAYTTTEALILSGGLGSATQARSQAQVEQSGSLLLGGRPEAAATVGLVAKEPWGYGAGVQPSLTDIDTAKSSMAASGYPPDNGYVEKYMFGDGYELHSLVGDLWIGYGIGGLVFLLLVAFLVLYGVSRLFVELRLDGIVIYLGIAVLWDIPFSPIYGSTLPLILYLGLICTELTAPAQGRGLGRVVA